jgi:hypothetical protein
MLDIAKIFDQCQNKPVLNVNVCKKINVAQNKGGKMVKANTASTQSGKHFRKIICNFCKKPGHKSNVCRAKGASATPNQSTQHTGKKKKNLVCWNCKKPGHKASECRSRASTNMAQVHTVTTQPQSSAQSREPEQVDQVAQKFWKLTTAIATHSSHGTVDEMLYVIGTVQQIPMKLYFDTGATASIISAKMVHQHQLLIKPSEIKIKSANNAITPVIGVTETMEITIDGYSCLLPLLVMDHEDHDVLLGINWFEQFPHTGIFPKEKKLIINQQVILLQQEHSEEIQSVTKIDLDDESEESSLEQSNYAEIDQAISDDDLNTDWTFSRKIIEPAETLTPDEDIFFKKIQDSAKNMFASSYQELGCVQHMPFTIRTTDEIPIYTRPYRKAETDRQIINNEVKMMLDAKIIRPSNSPWSSPVVLIKKQDGSIRMCVDYRPINKKTINEPWPLPRIDDIFDRMYGSHYFTSLDLKSGYWQVPMADDSIEKTAFSTTDGHYEFLRLPFGLRCAPLHFSKMMHMLLSHLPFVEVYLDDITIHSKDVMEHYKHTAEVLSVLRKVNLKLNFSKCKWFAKKIKLLGHIITGARISVDPKRTEAIKDRLPPKNIRQLQQFLGFCNYYKKFIKGLADISVPFLLLE